MAAIPSLADVVELLERIGNTHAAELQALRDEVQGLRTRNAALEQALQNEKDAAFCLPCADQALGSETVPGSHKKAGPLQGDEFESLLPFQSQVSISSEAPWEAADSSESFLAQASTGSMRRNSAMLIAGLQLKPSWQAATKKIPRMKSAGRKSQAALAWLAEKGQSLAAQETAEFGKSPSRFVALPGGRKRLAWDLFGGFLILYDLVSIPLKLFNHPDHWFTDLADWVTLLYWTFNIGMTLTVGYNERGKLVMSPKRIFIHYFKTWFVIDLLVVTPDWIFTFAAMTMDEEDGSGDSVKLLRVLRLARTIRLLRLLKLKWILEMINDLLDSEYASIVANICKMVLLLLAINHFIACAWFGVGTFSKDSSLDSWISRHQFDKVSWNHQYIVSFHWSITQFTPSSMDVQPHNIYERTFAIVVVVFALVGFSYVVGSITGSLTQLRNMSEIATKEFWKLRRFLRKNEISQSLSWKIKKFVEHAYKKQKSVMPLESVSMLRLLSDHLMVELHYELNVGHLDIHPFFDEMKTVALPCLQKLCARAVTHKQLGPHEIVFLPGSPADCMCFPTSGQLSYSLTNDAGKPLRDQCVRAGEAWLAEAAIWAIEWAHLGVLTALQEADLLLVSACQFDETVKQDGEALRCARDYAAVFIKFMQALGSSVSDLMLAEDSDDLRMRTQRGGEPFAEASCERRPSLLLGAVALFSASAPVKQAELMT